MLLGLHVCWVGRVERAVIEVGGLLCDLFSGQLYGVVFKLPEAVPGVGKWVVWVGVCGDCVVSLCVFVHKFEIRLLRGFDEAHGGREFLSSRDGPCILGLCAAHVFLLCLLDVVGGGADGVLE